MPASRVVVVGDKYQPFEAMVLLWSLASGVLHFVQASAPTALDLVLPGWAVAGWYVLLGAGGLVGLVGIAWQGFVHGLLLERAALFAVAAPTAVYALCAIYVGGWRAIVAAGLVGAWSAAAVWRIWQINRTLKAIARGAG